MRLVAWRTPLLPHLRSVTLALSLNTLEVLPILLLHRSVQDITILMLCSISELSVPYCNAICSFPHVFPDLRSLTLVCHPNDWGRNDDPALWAPSVALLEAIPQFRSLETFRYDMVVKLPNTALIELSKLPTLKRLYISRCDVVCFDEFSDGCFPALRSLNVTGDFADVKKLWNVVTSTDREMQDLDFNFFAFQHGALSGLISTIIFYSSSLQRLGLSMGPNGPPLPLSRSIFDPLLSCSRLERFSFRLHGCADFADEDLERFATAWPRLENFALMWSDRQSFRPRTTLYGLSAFVKHCPRLTHLHATIDAPGTFPYPHLSEPSHNPPSKVTELNIESGPCASVKCVVDFLRYMFPHLSRLVHKEILTDRRAGWTEVNAQILGQ